MSDATRGRSVIFCVSGSLQRSEFFWRSLNSCSRGGASRPSSVSPTTPRSTEAPVTSTTHLCNSEDGLVRHCCRSPWSVLMSRTPAYEDAGWTAWSGRNGIAGIAGLARGVVGSMEMRLPKAAAETMESAVRSIWVGLHRPFGMVQTVPTVQSVRATAALHGAFQGQAWCRSSPTSSSAGHLV